MACILVVEDDGALRNDLADRLTDWGHRVVQASNGRQGFDAIKTFQPDLVLADIHMPMESGFALTRRVAADDVHHADMAILLISATTDPKDVIHGIDCGASDYLPKPIDYEMLKTKIDAHLGKKTKSLRPLQPSSSMPHFRWKC